MRHGARALRAVRRRRANASTSRARLQRARHARGAAVRSRAPRQADSARRPDASGPPAIAKRRQWADAARARASPFYDDIRARARLAVAACALASARIRVELRSWNSSNTSAPALRKGSLRLREDPLGDDEIRVARPARHRSARGSRPPGRADLALGGRAARPRAPRRDGAPAGRARARSPVVSAGGTRVVAAPSARARSRRRARGRGDDARNDLVIGSPVPRRVWVGGRVQCQAIPSRFRLDVVSC